ncbi:MAG: RsmB/NOP family class I SAM-dependent RNA methyltransferase [Bauldia sp.]
MAPPHSPAVTASRAPPGLAARAAALSALVAVRDRGEPLENALGESDAESDAGSRDRAFARAIVGSTLRHSGEIAAILSRLIERKLPRRSGALSHILELAVAQIVFLGVPDHAAVSTALALADADSDARHFKGLANAVLRRLGRERETLVADLDAARLNTPDWLWHRWAERYGEELTRRFASAHGVEPALDLTLRGNAADWTERLQATALPNGSLRLAAKGTVESLAGYAEGAWWVQDAAAALPARLLGDVRGLAVADLCAAPGGKTAQLAAAGAKVTAVDRSPSRLRRLNANLSRLRLSAETVDADIRQWNPGRTFDAVLLDAPCSATGTIRRHPDIPFLKTPADIAALASLQAELLAAAAALTRPGGTLVYCTCSLEPEEGEDQARRALAALPLESLPIAAGEAAGLGTISTEGWLRTLPSDLPNADPRLGGLAGFFVARFRRTT